MSGPYAGRRVPRIEDRRLLTGSGQFTADVPLPDLLEGVVLRSPHAHARIRRIDTSAAAAHPGVALVLTARDLGPLGEPLPMLLPHPLLKSPRTHRALATDVVRYVGEPVAFVVARDRYVAEDAAERIVVEYEPLPAAVDLVGAVAAAAPLVHPDLDTNRACEVVQSFGDIAAARRTAPLVIREHLVVDRGCAQPIETRALVASVAPSGELRVWASTQAPAPLRRGLAWLLGLSEDQVRVSALDVGGGFGPKMMVFYPEEVLVPLAAQRLGRAVRWVEDRREHFVATTHERQQIHDATLWADADGRILGFEDRFLYDAGAYIPYGLNVPMVTLATLLGPYRIPHFHVSFQAVYTNKTMTSPYRGSGRPEAVFVTERMMRRLAEAVGLDPVEVKRRNLLRPNELPHRFGLTYFDGAPLEYDTGDYPRALDMALEKLEYERWRQTQRDERCHGRYLGIGVACYVEATGIGPYEGARVQVRPTGRVSVASAVGSQGQGQQTSLAQLVADELHVPLELVEVEVADTQRFGWGVGTYASRSAVTAGTSAKLAAADVRHKALAWAARVLEARQDDLELIDGTVRVKGNPTRSVTLADLATMAAPLRGAVKPPTDSPFEPGLEAVRYFAPTQATFANGVHAVVAEVDPDTGGLSILRYVVVHDCGRLINPLIVEGQITGGVVQGIGGAFFERLVYDDSGQLLTTTLMDYLLPTACEAIDVEIVHLESPTPLNFLGVKGVGEAGTIPVHAVVAEAVEDALAPFGVRLKEMPLDPARLWTLIAGVTRQP